MIYGAYRYSVIMHTRSCPEGRPCHPRDLPPLGRRLVRGARAEAPVLPPLLLLLEILITILLLLLLIIMIIIIAIIIFVIIIMMLMIIPITMHRGTSPRLCLCYLSIYLTDGIGTPDPNPRN